MIKLIIIYHQGNLAVEGTIIVVLFFSDMATIVLFGEWHTVAVWISTVFKSLIINQRMLF